MHSRGSVAAFALASGWLFNLSSLGYEGYGYATVGGAGGDVYHVRNLKDSGAGSLRDGITNRSGPRTVIFDVAGDITLQTDILVRQPYLTVDGSTAPPPGITIHHTTITDGEFIIGGTHDIIVRHLRFQGLWQAGGTHSQNAATITIDGDEVPDHVAQRIVIDHVTGRNSTDGGPDVWGEVRDVTISWCFLYYNWHPTLVSHYPAPYQTRQRVSLHHNVYAKNNERQPQLRADVRDFDYVNNVVYDWGYFGESSGTAIRIKNIAGEPKCNGNFVNNYFLPTIYPQWALTYGIQPGRDSEDGGPSTDYPQGTVVTNTLMGNLWVAGNMLPRENRDQYSTVAAPLPVAAAAQVTTYPATSLRAGVVPFAGWKFRTAEEQAILDELFAKMQGPARAFADLDGDGSVDASDALAMAGCAKGAGVVQSDSGCAAADLDGDRDVDMDDFGRLQRCMAEADVPSSPECIE